MTKKSIWLLVSCLMVISLITASCGTSEEEEEETETGEAEVTITEEEEEEEVVEEEEEEGLLSPEVPKYGGVMITGGADPRGWDPGIQQVVNVNQVRFTNESLIRGDWGKGLAGTGEIDWTMGNMGRIDMMTGCLAESWETPDPETTIYHIRQGVYWWDKPPMNGREFDAYDAEWCLNREWSSNKSYPRMSNVPENWPTSIKALDKWTLEIKAPAQSQGVMFFVDEYIRMMPREVVEMYGDMNDWENVCGTGPYMLTDYVTSSSTTYTRNPNYWGVDPIHPENQLPYMDGLKELIISDTSTSQASFRTGKTDKTAGITTDDWKMFMNEHPELQYNIYYSSIQSYVCAKIDDPDLPFKDIKVRQAMNLAVDQVSILEDYYGGYATMLGYPFLPIPSFGDAYVPIEDMPAEPTADGSECSVQELFTYNPEKARQLLDDAGYPNGFKTEILCSSTQADFLSIIQGYLQDVGIDMELTLGDGSMVAAAIKGRNFNEMCMSMSYPFAYYKMHCVKVPDASNATGFSTPITEAAYETVLANLGKDDAAVMNAVKDIVPYILENSWGIWTPAQNYYTLWWPWLQNYHGESNFGSSVPHEERIWLWYDTALKKSMGY